MTTREKLMGLLKSSKLCSKRFDDQYSDETIAIIADYLIKNGVIVADTNYTKREDLIRACEEITNLCETKAACYFCTYRLLAPFCTGTAVAEHLADAGVIFPPVKVGEPIYVIHKVMPSMSLLEQMTVTEVSNQRIWVDSNCFDYDDIGKTVFLTREKAEKALAKIIENK